jgi:hypothetical protein
MFRQVFKALAVISLFGMLAAPVVQAQSGMLVANIPFQFNVGKAVLPSGEYHVSNLESYPTPGCHLFDPNHLDERK